MFQSERLSSAMSSKAFSSGEVRHARVVGYPSCVAASLCNHFGQAVRVQIGPQRLGRVERSGNRPFSCS
eukprot:818620-Heterocapsa_arctica.AAC.1